MKKINYRQYYYADMELQVPDECSLYEIGMINTSHKVQDIGEASPDELVEIGKECKKICSICRLRKLTYTGIEASNVCFKDWVYGEAMASMNIINIKFGRIFMEEFTTDESELFLKESEKIYY